MKRKIVSWLLVFAGLMLLLSGIVLGNSLVKKIVDINGQTGLNKCTVNVKNMIDKDGESKFTEYEMEQLSQVLNNKQIAYSAEKKVQVEGGDRKSDALVIGTNSVYDKFTDLGIKAGSYFTVKSEQENDRVAVIQDTLAWELFKTDNVVGMRIEIFGQPFRIIGVAKEDESIVQTMSKSGISALYIPASTFLEMDESAGITNFQVRTKDSSLLGKNKGEIVNALGAIGKSSSNYKITDFNIERALISQKPLLLIFVMGAAGIVVMLVFIKNNAVFIYRNIRRGMKSDYLTGVVKENRFDLGVKLAKMLAALTAIAIIWNVVRFELYIPANYIPDKLTEVSYYSSLIKTHWQEANANVGYIAPFYEMRYNTAVVHLERLFYLAFLGGFGLLTVGFYQLWLQNTEIEEAFIFCSLAVVLGLTILAAVSKMVSIPLNIELKGLLTIYGYLLLNIICFVGIKPLKIKS